MQVDKLRGHQLLAQACVDLIGRRERQEIGHVYTQRYAVEHAVQFKQGDLILALQLYPYFCPVVRPGEFTPSIFKRFEFSLSEAMCALKVLSCFKKESIQGKTSPGEKLLLAKVLLAEGLMHRETGQYNCSASALEDALKLLSLEICHQLDDPYQGALLRIVLLAE